jgi:choice-of-anchor C domain-containing protein
MDASANATRPPQRNIVVELDQPLATRLLGRALALMAATVLGLVALPAWASATPSPARGDSNLIVNGGFESPAVCPGQFDEYDRGSTAIPGWVVGGNSVDLVCHTYFVAAAGRQSIDLSGSTSGSVSQAVSTTPHETYRLSWYMAGNTNCGQAVKTMHVFWHGRLIEAPRFSITGHTNQSMGWVKKQVDVTATGATSNVEFADATPDHSECGATVDSVSLTRIA